MAQIEIAVQGMRCEGCERTLRHSLDQLEGVRRVRADHEAGRVRVSFDPERMDERRLRARIEQAGYRPLIGEID